MQALAFNFIFEMGNCQKAFKNGTSKIDCIVKIIWKSNKVDKIKKFLKKPHILWELNFKL